jgi:hypothetical protein
VYHSGKSTSARLIANRIWESRRDVKFIKARSVSIPEDIHSAEIWFRRVVGFVGEGDNQISLADCFKKYSQSKPSHTTIIIDEADAILNFHGWDELIRDLAHGAIDDDKLFNVMLCCSDPKKVAKILDLNGRTKIKLIGRGIKDPVFFAKWTKNEIETFISDNYNVSQTIFDRLVSLGEVAGSPEIIKSILESGEAESTEGVFDQAHDLMAAIWDRRWVEASKVINTFS